MMQRGNNKRRDWACYVRSIFLRYMDQHPATFHTAYFPPFFQRELDLSDCYSYLRKMYRKGYLEKGEGGYLTLTGRGREVIQEEHLRLFDMAEPYVSVTELEREREKLPEDEPFDSAMLTLLLQKIPAMRARDDFNAVRDIHLDVAQIYERLGEPGQAMHHYLTALYLDVSGLDCYDKLVRYVHGRAKRSDAKAAYRGVAVRPEIANGLRRLKDHFDEKTVDDIFREEPIAITMLTRKEVTRLASELCQGTYDYNTWQTRGEAAYAKMLAQADRFKKGEIK